MNTAIYLPVQTPYSRRPLRIGYDHTEREVEVRVPVEAVVAAVGVVVVGAISLGLLAAAAKALG